MQNTATNEPHTWICRKYFAERDAAANIFVLCDITICEWCIYSVCFLITAACTFVSCLQLRTSPQRARITSWCGVYCGLHRAACTNEMHERVFHRTGQTLYGAELSILHPSFLPSDSPRPNVPADCGNAAYAGCCSQFAHWTTNQTTKQTVRRSTRTG